MSYSILNYVPPGFIPSDEQVKILLEVERVWDQYKFIILDAPVALGKSIIALTILAWQRGGSYIVPNNILLDQITREFPDMPSRRARERYICPKGCGTSASTWTCDRQARTKAGACLTCPMIADFAKDMASPYGVYTYYGYYSNKKYRNLLILDEAHKAISWLRELHTKQLPRREFHWPNPSTPRTLLTWAEAENGRRQDAGKKAHKGVSQLVSVLQGKNTKNIAYRAQERIWGRMEDVIKISPAICSGHSLWHHQKVEKVVLMSATLSKLREIELGLPSEQTIRISSESSIPAANRPAIFRPVAAVTWKNREEAVDLIASEIAKIASEHPEECGMVHLPYELAKAVRERFRGNMRYIWHDRDNKSEMLDVFLGSRNGVFLASGFAEGLSLNYDKARFNIICKAMFPNKADGFVQQMSLKFPNWPVEEAITHMLQAYGRTTRRPDDKSITYFLDSMSLDLYKSHPNSFPHWFKEAVIIGG